MSATPTPIVAEKKSPRKFRLGQNLFAAAFTPNGTLPSRAMRVVTMVHIAIAVALWMLIPESTFPGPMTILRAIRRLWFEQALGREMFTSLILNLHMILCVTLLALPLGYARTVPFFQPLVKFMGNFRFLGLTGLTLIFTAYTVGSHSLKLSILTFSVGVYYVTSLARIVDAVPQAEFDYVETLGMSEWRSLYEVVIRGRAAEMLEALRQNAAMGWMMLTAVEGLSKSEGGIGTILLQSQRLWRLEDVYAIQLSLWVLGLLQDYLFGFIRRNRFPYADLRAKGGR